MYIQEITEGRDCTIGKMLSFNTRDKVFNKAAATNWKRLCTLWNIFITKQKCQTCYNKWWWIIQKEAPKLYLLGNYLHPAEMLTWSENGFRTAGESGILFQRNGHFINDDSEVSCKLLLFIGYYSPVYNCFVYLYKRKKWLIYLEGTRI